jgi:hypothetical protein
LRPPVSVGASGAVSMLCVPLCASYVCVSYGLRVA